MRPRTVYVCTVGSAGKERDAETGLDYFGARYMSSAQGRFASPDWSARPVPVPYAQLDNPQSLNLYAYVRNNPLRSADVDGHTDYYTQNGERVGSDGYDNGAVAVVYRNNLVLHDDGSVNAAATKTEVYVPRQVGEALNEIVDRSNRPTEGGQRPDQTGGMHEEGFTARPDGRGGFNISYAAPGPAFQRGDTQAHVTQNMPQDATFVAHTHPRGDQQVQFNELPSGRANRNDFDLGNARMTPAGVTLMVAGAETRRVAFYDHLGTTALIPLAAFPRRPR